MFKIIDLKKRTGQLFFGVLLVVSTISSANALIINRVDLGGTAHASTVGGGTLANIFNSAADVWESMIQDSHTLDLTFSWAALGGGTQGVHNLLGQIGGRETSGNIRFDNDGSTIFYADTTPLDNSEWAALTTSSADLGGGIMNTGNVYSGASGLATGRFDLFSVALHEIGHALGLSSANLAFQAENPDGDIDIVSGPFAGATIATTSGAHLNIGTAVMFPPPIGLSSRKLITEADLWANCSISKFTDCGARVSVDSPATSWLFGVSLLGIWFNRRRVSKVS